MLLTLTHLLSPMKTSRGDNFTPPSPLSTGSVTPDFGVIPLHSV